MDELNRTRSSLIARARDGDAEEFASLYAPLVRAMALKCGLDGHDADDIMQQTMLEVLRGLASFDYDRERGTFKGFLRTVVRRRTSNLLSRRLRGADVDLEQVLSEREESARDTFDDEWEKAQLRAACRLARAEVQPRTFEAFDCYRLRGWPVGRVADHLGLSRNQVSQYARRVSERIRMHLAALTDELG